MSVQKYKRDSTNGQQIGTVQKIVRGMFWIAVISATVLAIWLFIILLWATQF